MVDSNDYSAVMFTKTANTFGSINNPFEQCTKVKIDRTGHAFKLCIIYLAILLVLLFVSTTNMFYNYPTLFVCLTRPVCLDDLLLMEMDEHVVHTFNEVELSQCFMILSFGKKTEKYKIIQTIIFCNEMNIRVYCYTVCPIHPLPLLSLSPLSTN